MRVDWSGVTRMVILVGPWAVKLPRLNYGWAAFLRGLLCNIQESEFGRLGWPGFCPVRFALPGGWLIVMPRAQVMTDEEFAAFDFHTFVNRGEYVIPAEEKPDSFGWLNGQVVAIDYGS